MMNNRQPKYYKLITGRDQYKIFYKVTDKVFYLAEDDQGNKKWIRSINSWCTICKVHHTITELSYQELVVELL